MPLSQLLAFLADRAPDVHAGLRGAHPDDIEELAELCPRPLPATYREFLRVMGRASGSFIALPEADARPGTLWPHLRANRPSYPDDRYFKIGRDLGGERDIRSDWFLDLQQGDPDDPPLVTFEDEGELADFDAAQVHVVAPAWTAWLHARAFLAYAVAARASVQQATFAAGADPARRLARVAELCERLGATARLPARPGLHMLERRDLSLLLSLAPDAGALLVHVGADAGLTVQNVLEIVRDDLER